MSPTEGPGAGSVSASASAASFATSANGADDVLSPRVAAPKWKGRILRRFKLVDLLGQGSMGKVFRAEDVTLRRYVALKVLPTKTKAGQRDHKIDQFVREARSAASIDHPNAVTVYEIGESAGVHYIAMELVEGGNLEKLIKASGPMEIDRACQIAAEAAEALAAAHAQGIIHRDVKPSNLLLARNGRCKIADFGLARYEDPEDLTPRGECVGTPCYIAPELPLGQKATAQSDIYSLGCALWFLLTGKPPFEARTKQDMMKMHVYASLPDIRERRGDIPDRLVEAISRACAKNPADRFESADQFAKVLRTFTIRTGTGSSSRLPTLGGGAGGTHASGSLPAWSPDAAGGVATGATSASSTNLGPHLSQSASNLGSIPPLSAAPAAAAPSHAAEVSLLGMKLRVSTPIVWASIGTVAAVVLIGIGVWIARGNNNGASQAVASPPTGNKPPAVAPSPARDKAAAVGAAGAAGAAGVQTGTDVLANGGLEEAEGSDGIAGWFVAPKYEGTVEFVSEDSNRFARLKPGSASDTPHVDQKIDIDPSWTAVTLAARMRASDLKGNGAKPADARVVVEFHASGEKGLGAHTVPGLKSDSPWVERLLTVNVPEGAKYMYVRLAVNNATGTVDFDDVRVIPQISMKK